MKAMKVCPLLTCVCVCASMVLALNVDIPTDITYAALDKRIDELRPCVVSIEMMPKPDSFVTIGSGYLVTFRGSNWTVTCRHVVEHLPQSVVLAVGLNTKYGKVVVKASVSRTSRGPDAALLRTGGILSWPAGYAGQTDTLSVLHAGVGLSMFTADSGIREGAGVLMMGYPLGIGVSKEIDRPVSRLGMIAQGVVGDSMFLVDGTASHGNSGSPVFLCKTGQLAGMVSAQASDKIEAFDDRGTMIASLPYNAGLTACIPASAIRAFLEER